MRELDEVRPTYLVCRKLDRLHRNTLQWEYLQHRLLRAGVEAVAQFPSLVGFPELRHIGSPRERAWASMEATWASLEKEELKEKLMAGRRERAAQGLPDGGHAPYGYRRKEPRGPLVVCEDEAAVYERMPRWTIEGRGSAWIAHELNRLGVPTRSGRVSWSATTVRRIVASEAQTGMIRVRVDGAAGVASRDRAAAHRGPRPLGGSADTAERAPNAGGVDRGKHVLAGLLRCSACGKTLKARCDRHTRRGRRYEYWTYTCKVYDSGCRAGSSISERRALAEIAEQVNARLRATREWACPDLSEGADDAQREVETLRRRLADAQRALRRAEDRYETAPDDMLARALQRLHEREGAVRELTAQLERAQLLVAQRDRDAHQVDVTVLRTLLDSWEAFSDGDKRAVLEVVMDHAVLGPRRPGRRLSILWR